MVDLKATIVAEVDTRHGLLLVTRLAENYTITVAGEVKHPNVSADEVVGAMAHYLYQAEYSLMKRKNASNVDDLCQRLYTSGMTGPRHGLSKHIGDLLLDAYVALGGSFDHLRPLTEEFKKQEKKLFGG